MPPSKEIAGVLEAAAKLIEPEGAWIKGSAAKAADGSDAVPYSKRAVCWCMEGAIAAVTRHQWMSEPFYREPAYLFLDVFIKAGSFNGSIYRWNDSHTQRLAVAKLREAAAKAREQSA